jgi:DNA-binding transcriptional regulator YiaG
VYFLFYGENQMDCKNRIIKLRESTGMNRKDFCKCVHIPYRTMTEWELDNRHAPDYVLWLLEYYVRNEGLMVKEIDEGGGDSEKEAN